MSDSFGLKLERNRIFILLLIYSCLTWSADYLKVHTQTGKKSRKPLVDFVIILA